MSTEWIVLVWSIKHAVTVTYEFTYSSSDRLVDDTFKSGNTVPHENVFIRKLNLQKTLEIMEIS